MIPWTCTAFIWLLHREDLKSLVHKAESGRPNQKAKFYHKAEYLISTISPRNITISYQVYHNMLIKKLIFYILSAY